MQNFIDVILPLAVKKTFTYEVSEAEFEYIHNGMRIAVPFGKSKIYTSLVVDKHKNPPLLYKAKEINCILDEIAIVNSFQLEHWKWISNYYMCSLGEVFKSALPSGYMLESETIISEHKNNEFNIDDLKDEEYLIYEALKTQSSITIKEIIKILSKKTIFPIINNLLSKGVLVLQEEIKEVYKPKLVRYIKISDAFLIDDKLQEVFEILGRAKKQHELVLHYFQLNAIDKKPISVKQLLDFSKSTSSVLKALVDKGIFEEYHLHEDRVIFKKEDDVSFVLSPAQEKCFNEIEINEEKFDVTLLHGITASGKTEVYMKLIEKYLKEDKQVLFLLPEIALTTQLVQRLSAYFGNQISVFHSKYTNNERIEVWNNVLHNSDKAKVVIGVGV